MSEPADEPPRRPPLKALEAFEATARHLSFSRAADELGVTTGAISQQIRALEELVGQPLFRRLGRSVTLTDPARAALPALQRGFAEMGEAVRTLRLPLRRSRISVSAAPSFAAKWLVPRLDRFEALEPDVEVWIAATMDLVDFAIDDVDVAIRYGGGHYDGVVSERLMSESVVPVCSPQLQAALLLDRPVDLVRATLLHDGSAQDDPSCPDWTSWLEARGVQKADSRRGPRFNQSSLVIEAAIAGQGVALAKHTLAAADIAAGRLVALFTRDDTARLNFAYWLVRPKGRSITPAVRAFLDWVQREAGGEDYAI